jgi:acyl dehydratase
MSSATTGASGAPEPGAGPRRVGAPSAPARYFEDFAAGDCFESAPLTVSEALIIEFGRTYDAQLFHVDPEAAKATVYGGLIASGLQTIALTFKLFLETGTIAASSLGSPGLDEIRWKVPVRPGDTLRVVAEVLETRPSASKADRGIVRIRYTTVNQDGAEAMTMIGNQLLRRRGAG